MKKGSPFPMVPHGGRLNRQCMTKSTPGSMAAPSYSCEMGFIRKSGARLFHLISNTFSVHFQYKSAKTEKVVFGFRDVAGKLYAQIGNLKNKSTREDEGEDNRDLPSDGTEDKGKRKAGGVEIASAWRQ